MIQEIKKENFDLKLRLYMEQKEREVRIDKHGATLKRPSLGPFFVFILHPFDPNFGYAHSTNMEVV